MSKFKTAIKENIIKKTRRYLAERLLPPDCFVQQNPNFNYVLNYFPNFMQDAALYNNEFTRARKKLLRDGNRWLSINLLINIANLCDYGDFAELGTYRGSTARLLWNRIPADASLYCFDTFEGFTEGDISKEFDKTALVTEAGAFSDTSMGLVRRAVLRSEDHRDEPRLILKKGEFPSTFKDLENHSWRFVHLDCDLYAPIKAGLECFWKQIVPGGVLLVHDYNAGFFGVKKAVDEFFAPLGIVPIPLCDKVGSVVVVKNRIQTEVPSSGV